MPELFVWFDMISQTLLQDLGLRKARLCFSIPKNDIFGLIWVIANFKLRLCGLIRQIYREDSS